MFAVFQRVAARRVRATLRAFFVSLLTVGSGLVSAGFVTTTFESGLDDIFSQTSFGARPIDIRFNAALTVVANNLLTIDSDAEFDALSALRGGLTSNIVSVFFVDSIPFCGGPGGNIIGCGATPGNVIALKSTSAANASIGANLLAHELGHNLGLDHVSGNNLMNATISSFSLTAGSFLNPDQVARIFETLPSTGGTLRNSIIQRDVSGGYFISITPFAVVAVVPEPETWLMMVLGLFGITLWLRRPQRKACVA